MEIHPMEALRETFPRPSPAREAPTGPQVRTSVRDKPRYKSKDESKRVDFKNYNNTFGCTKVKGDTFVGTTEKHSRNDICGSVGSVQGQRERGRRHSAGSAAWAGRVVVCDVMPVPQEQGAGRVNGGRAKVAERWAER
ncbi:hypothetical protein K438DRAFT_1770807 [Mycena galopus ATCC 62051]|nr:hypothetical protein K438DRAFT_1770807 [Mycena galopus ATCC 62051]